MSNAFWARVTQLADELLTHILIVHELHIMSYSYTMSIWESNSSSNWATRAQNALLIMS